MQAGEHPHFSYRIAGRIISRRGHGKTTFIDLRDYSGEIQLAVRHDTLGEEAYERTVDLDIGDIVEAEGPIYVTQRGQLALGVHRCVLLTKALDHRPTSATASATRVPATATESSTYSPMRVHAPCS